MGRGDAIGPRPPTRSPIESTDRLANTNLQSVPQSVRVQISGADKIESSAEAVTLSADSPEDTNSIQEPEKIIPVTTTVDGLGSDFTREFPPYSITVLEMKGK